MRSRVSCKSSVTFALFYNVVAHARFIIFSPMTLELTPYRVVLPLVYNLRPASLRRKIVEWTPSAKIQRLKEIIDIQDQQVNP